MEQQKMELHTAGTIHYKKLLFEGKLADNMETLFIWINCNHRQRKQMKLELKADLSQQRRATVWKQNILLYTQ